MTWGYAWRGLVVIAVATIAGRATDYFLPGGYGLNIGVAMAFGLAPWPLSRLP